MNLFNRGPPVWLNLIYVVEGEVLRILTQAVLKNIEPFGFYEGFTDPTLKLSFFTEKFSRANISRMVGSNDLKFFVEVHRDDLYLPLKRSELFKIRTQALFVTTLVLYKG